MLKRLLLLVFILTVNVVYASAPALRAYDEYKIPAGYFIPVINLQEFSTAYTEEGESLGFLTTSDIFLFDKNVIPKGTRLIGYIEKKNEPVVGTNASMKIFINKMYLTDGYEVPVKAYLYNSNNNMFGGELTKPETYIKKPHYQRWSMFRAMGVLQYVPGDKRRMGEHITISSGANLTVVLVAPINMSHVVIN